MHRHVCGHNAYASRVWRATARASAFGGSCGVTSMACACVRARARARASGCDDRASLRLINLFLSERSLKIELTCVLILI